MKQIHIITAALVLLGFNLNQGVYAQEKKAVKEKIEKQERQMEKEVKDEKHDMKAEMQRKKQEMKEVKEAHKEEVKEIKREHKDRIDDIKDHDDDNGYAQNPENKNKIKTNNGNAYGRNKGGLEGREFGQTRAAEARAKLEKREMDIRESEVIIIDGRRRIEAARERLRIARENNTISDDQYLVKLRLVENAQDKLSSSERALERYKATLMEQNKRLSGIIKN